MSMIGKPVIVRTINSGVHFGTLALIEGQQVVLHNARKIWFWDGAFTLAGVAAKGINKKSKVSVSVSEILINEVIEVILCTAVAEECLNNITAHGE